jgi:hypothetical protein
LPSVGWCTGQSGAPPDSPCSCPVRDLFLFLAHPTVDPRDRLVHGAHRTVRCAQPTVAAGHASPADCAAERCAGDRWLTGQPGAPLDSPVNCSHVAFFVSRERRVRRGRLAGQSGAPPDSPMNYSCTPPSIPESSLFTWTSLAHWTLSGVPSRAGVGCTEPSLFPILSFLFLALRKNMLVLKTMY